MDPHLSISGGMVNALDEAERLQMECVQVFTKNQRRWSSPPLKDSDIAAWSIATEGAWLERSFGFQNGQPQQLSDQHGVA